VTNMRESNTALKQHRTMGPKHFPQLALTAGVHMAKTMGSCTMNGLSLGQSN